MTGGGSVASVLSAIADPARPAIDARVAIVVAHPDDETLGCGALLHRLRHATLVHVTDGAPRDGADARRHGYPDPAAYAAARRTELADALRIGGVEPERSVFLDLPDQGVVGLLDAVASRLWPILAGQDVVLTHAYEGGHPDHDATALAVGIAVERLRPGGPAILAMPFYRAGPGRAEWVRQEFGADGSPASVLRLTDAERRSKLAMLGAHRSQADTLSPFGAADEAFRPAGPLDVFRPPNGGHVLYEGFGWGSSAADLCREAAAVLSRLVPDRAA